MMFATQTTSILFGSPPCPACDAGYLDYEDGFEADLDGLQRAADKLTDAVYRWADLTTDGAASRHPPLLDLTQPRQEITGLWTRCMLGVREAQRDHRRQDKRSR